MLKCYTAVLTLVQVLDVWQVTWHYNGIQNTVPPSVTRITQISSIYESHMYIMH